MEVVSLNTDFEPVFWQNVNQDILHNFFFAFDWKFNRGKTKIFLALKQKRIDGMMLIYGQSIVQLRGNHEAARILLEHLDLEKVDLQAPKEHKQCVLEKYEPTWSHDLMLMVLHKGEEKLQTTHPIVKLDASDADQIAAIMRKADPEFWNEITADQIIEGKNGVKCFGIKVNGELVSVGRTRLTKGIDHGVGHIVTVATHEAHRNKGYATSIVSHSVRLIMDKMPVAVIYVLSDNPSAIKVYTKVGFEPYKTYFFVRGIRRDLLASKKKTRI